MRRTPRQARASFSWFTDKRSLEDREHFLDFDLLQSPLYQLRIATLQPTTMRGYTPGLTANERTKA